MHPLDGWPGRRGGSEECAPLSPDRSKGSTSTGCPPRVDGPTRPGTRICHQTRRREGLMKQMRGGRKLAGLVAFVLATSTPNAFAQALTEGPSGTLVTSQPTTTVECVE